MTELYIGADHRGFAKKQLLIDQLAAQPQLTIHDQGATTYQETDDFNDPAIAVAQAVAQDPERKGVLLCGSAHGVCMQANRFRGVRAVNVLDSASAQLARSHNDANVLCLSADQLELNAMQEIIQTFLATPFSQATRFVRRNQRLDEVNNG